MKNFYANEKITTKVFLFFNEYLGLGSVDKKNKNFYALIRFVMKV